MCGSILAGFYRLVLQFSIVSERVKHCYVVPYGGPFLCLSFMRPFSIYCSDRFGLRNAMNRQVRLSLEVSLFFICRDRRQIRFWKWKDV
jgi:hypothetical protein